MSGNVATCGHLNTSGSVVGALLLSPSAEGGLVSSTETRIRGNGRARREERDIRDRGRASERKRERGKTHSLST
jgi:hypothetical protein